MSEKTVAVYLTETEVGDIWQGLRALSNLVDTDVVPRVAVLREQFKEMREYYAQYPNTESFKAPAFIQQITLLRPTGMDASGLTDAVGTYVAMTDEAFRDIQSQLQNRVELIAAHEILKADYKRGVTGWTEIRVKAQNLESEVQRLNRNSQFWVEYANRQDQKLINLEAQRDVLIRAIGDLGDKVKP